VHRGQETANKHRWGWQPNLCTRKSAGTSCRTHPPVCNSLPKPHHGTLHSTTSDATGKGGRLRCLCRHVHMCVTIAAPGLPATALVTRLLQERVCAAPQRRHCDHAEQRICELADENKQGRNMRPTPTPWHLVIDRHSPPNPARRYSLASMPMQSGQQLDLTVTQQKGCVLVRGEVIRRGHRRSSCTHHL